MALKLLVVPQLDEAASQSAVRAAERAFGDAGSTAGEAMTQQLAEHLASARAQGQLENSLRYISRHGDQAGRDFAETMASRINTDLGQHIKAPDLTAHGREAAGSLAAGLQSMLPSSSLFSSVTDAASAMGVEISAGALVAGGAIAGIGVAAAAVGTALVGLGEKFESVSNTITITTGKVGSDLDSLTHSVDELSTKTAASVEQLGKIGAEVSVAFDTSGAPLERLTQQIAELDKKTGETTNVREFGEAMRGYGENATQASGALDAMYDASTKTLIPVNELISDVKELGPAARSMGLSMGETTALIEAFDKQGIDAGTTVMALNHAADTFASHGIDLQHGLQDTITQMKGFLDLHTAIGDREAIDLAVKVFGARGAQKFVDDVRSGNLNVKDLNDTLTSSHGDQKIQDMADRTKTLADNWQLVKNNIEDALKPLGDFAYKIANLSLGFLANPSGNDPHYQYGTPDAVGPSVPPPPGGPAGLLLPPPPGAPPPPDSCGFTPLNPAGPFNQFGSFDPLHLGTKPPPPPPPPQDIAGALDKGKGKDKGPVVPMPPEFGAPPEPGETQAEYNARTDKIKADHDLAQRQADLNALEADNTAKTEDVLKAKNDVIDAEHAVNDADLRLQDEKKKKLAKPETPYGPGYGAPPRPGETEAQYNAEQHLLEAQHTTADARANLAQVEADGAHTADELTKARNDLAKAEKDEYTAQLSLQTALSKTSAAFGDIGAKLDADFGLSKGLPGLADNLVRFIASLAAAPMEGQLAAQVGNSTGFGALGVAAAQCAFGPQYTQPQINIPAS